MQDVPRSRLTVAVAMVVIAATVALFVAGLVLAPEGESDEVDEASLVSTEDVPGDRALAPTSSAPAHSATHEHDEVAAAAASTPDTTAVHAHVEPAAEAADVATHDHEVAITVPVSPAEPAVAAPVHDHGSTTVPTTGETATAGPIVSIGDSRLSAAQQEAARSLLDTTRAAMSGFPDEASVVAAGYQSIGDAITGFEHFVHAEYLDDGIDLDPTHIESIVLRVEGGIKTVVSAMYILGTTATMVDVPDIAGELTTWHDHQNLCWDGLRVVAITRADGTCPRGEFRPTPPMLHVWLTDQACGPFSGIEGVHGSGCGAH